MTGSAQDNWLWKPSSIGITPLTVRPRAGKRHVTKHDLNGDAVAVPAVGGPGLQGQSAASGCGGGDGGRGVDPFKIVVPARVREGDGRGPEGAAPLISSTRPSNGRVCSVCTRASADYSCPRCLIGYCSSKCYKVSQLCQPDRSVSVAWRPHARAFASPGCRVGGLVVI